jgi:hypothetical protein
VAGPAQNFTHNNDAEWAQNRWLSGDDVRPSHDFPLEFKPLILIAGRPDTGFFPNKKTGAQWSVKPGRGRTRKIGKKIIDAIVSLA